jgi:hypothetical protein
MIEGPGHVPMQLIKENMDKQLRECGEAPFDRYNGLDCVRGECVDTSRDGALCWPGEDNRCVRPLTCLKKD